METLTRDGGGLLEDLGDLGVHGDDVVPLMGNLLVPDIHLLMHPLLEGLTHDGVDDVGEVATAELGDLLARGQRVLHLHGVGGEPEDLLDGEPLELGHGDDLDGVALDDHLDPHRQVPQVPDGDGLVAGQVGPDFAAEESVDFCTEKKQ
jgi:hypothetical protein